MLRSSHLWVFALLVLAACGQQPAPPGMKIGKPYVIDGKTYYPSYDSTYDKIGMASWYGPGFHGKYTANGERFDQNALTAAHPTLPMPSIVRVTNLENGQSAIIRINDRGPFKSNRIIDLSRKSAQTLGIHSLAKVRVQFLQAETEEYMASLGGSQKLDMASLNKREEDRKDASVERSTEPATSEIVESTVATSGSGQAVESAAPVMTVDSTDIAGSKIEVTDTPPPAKDPQPVTFAHERKVEPAQEVKVAAKPEKLVRINENETITEIDTSDAHDDAPEPGAITLNAPGKSEVRAEKPKTAKAAPAKEAAPSAGGNGFYVLAGSFASEENAGKLKSKLSSISKVKVERVEMSGKTWWRVRSGPFSDKTDADDTLSKVRSIAAPEARIVHQ